MKWTRPTQTQPSDRYIFITAQLWLTSHQRGTMVLLDTGTPGTSREIFSEDADGETSLMRSEPQLSNDKCIMMQYTNWINSTLSQQQLLSFLAQWLEHTVYNRRVVSSSLTVGTTFTCWSTLIFEKEELYFFVLYSVQL